MTRPPLTPGCAPARLLLTLWEAQAEGERWVELWPDRNLSRLLELEYVQPDNIHAYYRLTEAGGQAAAALEGSTP